MKKILTIVTVCYNSEKTIEKCIDSILSQLNEKVEYLIIDGKSKDSTVSIIKRKLKGNRYSKYISEEDSGIYNAMNKALNLALGEYILYINSDDELYPESLQKIIPLLEEKKYDVIYGDALATVYYKEREYIKPLEYNKPLSDINKSSILCHQATFTSKKVMEKLGGFDEKFQICADWELFLRIYHSGYKFKHINELVCFFSIDGISSTHPRIIERIQIRKKNKMMVFKYLIGDIKRIILVSGKHFVRKITKFDYDSYQIKKGIYKLRDDNI